MFADTGDGMIRRLLQKVLPKSLRVRLRKSAFIRKIMMRCFGGRCARPYPNSTYVFNFDGYRNIGFSTGSLEDQERAERAWVRNLFETRRPKTVWDVGANVGFWSLFLTTLAPDAVEIRCFEPDPVNLSFLRLNCEQNSIRNWTIRPVGVSDREGTAQFFTDIVTGSTGSIERSHNFSERLFASSRGEITIDLTTIDLEVERGAKPPEFIKMDVEGHELTALRGAVNTLRRFRPPLVLEVTAEHEKVGSLLRECGYNLYDNIGNPLTTPNYYTVATPEEWGGPSPSA